MALSHPPFYVPEILPIGEALLTHGLTNVGAIYPVGALAFGLFWPCEELWSLLDIPSSTSWSATSSTSSTTWTTVVRSEC